MLFHSLTFFVKMKNCFVNRFVLFRYYCLKYCLKYSTNSSTMSREEVKIKKVPLCSQEIQIHRGI